MAASVHSKVTLVAGDDPEDAPKGPLWQPLPGTSRGETPGASQRARSLLQSRRGTVAEAAAATSSTTAGSSTAASLDCGCEPMYARVRAGSPPLTMSADGALCRVGQSTTRAAAV